LEDVKPILESNADLATLSLRDQSFYVETVN
jgi:hypothetical protein